MDLKQFDWTCSAIPQMRYIRGGTSKLSQKMYSAYKEIGPQPDYDKFKKNRDAIVQSIPEKHAELKEIVSFLFFRIYGGSNPLFKVAEEFGSVSEFDYRKIISYFATKNTTDNMDRTIIQMVRQLLQIHYSEANSCW